MNSIIWKKTKLDTDKMIEIIILSNEFLACFSAQTIVGQICVILSVFVSLVSVKETH